MYFFDVGTFWITVRGLGAASLKVSGVTRGRREKEAELEEGWRRARHKGRSWRERPGPVPRPGGLFSSLCQGPGRLGQADGDKAALSARMPGAISHSAPSLWLGRKLVPGSLGEAMTDAPTGQGREWWHFLSTCRVLGSVLGTFTPILISCS